MNFPRRSAKGHWSPAFVLLTDVCVWLQRWEGVAVQTHTKQHIYLQHKELERHFLPHEFWDFFFPCKNSFD